MRTIILTLCLTLVLATPVATQAGWLDTVKDAGKKYLESTDSGSTTTSSITNTEAIKGLKAALDKAVDASIKSLGKQGGFMNNSQVKIPMPGTLGKMETALRLAGKTELADQFVTSMNRAAEKAVPFTKDTFLAAIKKMTFKDAMGILKGSDTAATDYFKRTMTPDLTRKIKPTVSEATDSVNVTRYYKNMTRTASMFGVKNEATDLDGYVTQKALDGLFYMMGVEEKNIRKNPLARTTDILKKVFSAQ